MAARTDFNRFAHNNFGAAIRKRVRSGCLKLARCTGDQAPLDHPGLGRLETIHTPLQKGTRRLSHKLCRLRRPRHRCNHGPRSLNIPDSSRFGRQEHLVAQLRHLPRRAKSASKVGFGERPARRRHWPRFSKAQFMSETFGREQKFVGVGEVLRQNDKSRNAVCKFLFSRLQRHG